MSLRQQSCSWYPRRGIVQSGSYVLVEALLYTGLAGASGPQGSAIRASLVFMVDGSYADTLEESPNEAFGLTGTYGTKGSQISLTETCSSPALPTVTMGFTSEGKQLVTFSNDAEGVNVSIYMMM
jgi:hypothetical protein